MPTYDVTISFAGEDRPVAESLASLLVAQGLNVFYDAYEQSNLWGKDLYVHLSKIYKDEAKYCLMLISEQYAKKQWTNHERRSAQARAFSESSEYILPLRLDDAKVDGILDTVGFLDYRKVAEERIVDAVVQKVHTYNKAHGITYDLVKVEDVFAKQAIGSKGGRPIRDSDMRTACPACGTEQLLSEAILSLDAGETVYTCRNGCQPIVVVGRPGIVAWPGRGYRLGDHVIRNVRDVSVKNEDMHAPMILNAREASLMKRRPPAVEEKTTALKARTEELRRIRADIVARIAEAAGEFDHVTQKSLNLHLRDADSALAKIEAELSALGAGDSVTRPPFDAQ